MGANNKINLKKFGEILIDINTKCKKNKSFIFNCTLCNIKCDQFHKFSLHIDEHLDSAENNLRETVIKFEAEPEEIGIPNVQKSDTSIAVSSNVKCEEFLIQEIKQEKEDTNDMCVKEEMDYNDSDVNEESDFINITNEKNYGQERDDKHQSQRFKSKADDEIYSKTSKDMQNNEENSPQVNTSSSRRYISKRKVQELEDCRKKCKEKVSREEQQYIFNQYWSLGITQQQQFVAGSIEVEYTQPSNPKNRRRYHMFKYYLELPNRTVPVCQKCFRYTICEGEKFIKTTMQKKIAGKLENIFFT